MATGNPQNDNVPSRIMFNARLSHVAFKGITNLLIKQNLLEFKALDVPIPGGRHKTTKKLLFITHNGAVFIETYHKALRMLGIAYDSEYANEASLIEAWTRPSK